MKKERKFGVGTILGIVLIIGLVGAAAVFGSLYIQDIRNAAIEKAAAEAIYEAEHRFDGMVDADEAQAHKELADKLNTENEKLKENLKDYKAKYRQANSDMAALNAQIELLKKQIPSGEPEVTLEEGSMKAEALEVVNGKLVVASTREDIQLKGISSQGLNWYPQYANPDALKYMHDEWGVNLFRLAMYTSDYNGYCVGGEENKTKQKELIKEAVNAADELGMYVIVDWHILGDGNPNTYKAEAIQFFGEMVREFADKDNVIYELCNEPNGSTTWADITAYANEVIPVIRNVKDNAIILVGTPNWSQRINEPMNAPLKFDNIMYTYHFYAGTHGQDMRDELQSAIDKNVPVFVSEFGISKADGKGGVFPEDGDKWLELVNKNGLSACIWGLSNKNESCALVDSHCDKVTDWTKDELSDQGKWMLEKFLGR